MNPYFYLYYKINNKKIFYFEINKILIFIECSLIFCIFWISLFSILIIIDFRYWNYLRKIIFKISFRITYIIIIVNSTLF